MDKLTLDGEMGDGDVSRDLNADRADGQMCDVVLVSGQHRVNAHRLVLAKKSFYFFTMFYHNFSEKEMPEVQLHESVDGEILETLIEYLYLGVIDIDETNAASLLAAADLLLMPKLMAGCWKFLKSHVHAGNSLRLWALASQYSESELLKEARKCTLKNFEKIAEGDDFLELDLAQLIDLLNDDRLAMKNEAVAYEAVMRWVRHHQDDRKAHLADILKSVRLLLCTGQFLAETVRTDDLIRESDECRRLVDEALTEHIDLRLKEECRRKPYFQTLYAIGGYGQSGSGAATTTVEKYDRLTNAFSSAAVTPMPVVQRYGIGCAAIDNKRIIVIIGGYGGTDLSSVECYDPARDKWSSLATLAVARGFFSVASLDGRVYVIGGQDSDGELLASMERYDSIGNSWTTSLPPMPTPRWFCRAVALNGQLYVLGGNTSRYAYSFCGIVERFDPATGVWSTMPPMRTARRYFGCAVFAGRIFVAGGEGSASGHLASVESFSTVAQQWSDRGSLCSGRHGLTLAVVDNRLLAIGGRKGNYDPVTTVEEYEPETDSWRLLCHMTLPRFFHGVAVVDTP